MEISSALSLIQTNLKYNVKETNHFKEKCKERNLKITKIRKIVKQNRVLGIVEQSHNLYNLWFYYKKDKDLNKIIRLINIDIIKFITIFPSDTKGRKRK